MIILGISCFYHDSAACLIQDGRIVAAVEEERFSRTKHDPSFPTQAIEFCLAAGGVVAEEVEAICFHERPLVKFHRIIDRHIDCFPRSYGLFRLALPRWFGEIFRLKDLLAERLHLTCPLYYFRHHLSHAAYTFYSSNFDRSAILIVDAVGEDSSASWGIGEGQTVTLKEEIPYPHSLGMLYTTITALLGFEVMEGEGKVMGLAAYGEPTYLEGMREIAPCLDNGSILLKPEYFAFDRANRMMSRKMEKYFFRARKPGEPIEQKHRDMAASIQAFLQERLIAIAKYVREKSGLDTLCLGGGVALNSVANGRLERENIFREVFIPPAPTDAGCAMGSALLHHYHADGAERAEIPLHAYLGTEYSPREIENFLKLKDIPYRELSDGRLFKVIAEELRNNKIVGWFQGKMEFGPRALGSRSILVTPAIAENRNILNSRVKGRESFRPFGASVLEEEAGHLFENAVPSPFMQKIFRVRPESAGRIPAVVHEDGTCRVHTVAADCDDPYRQLIEAFNRETDLPIILNTSFNRKGEPIVSNPREAYQCFVNSGMDMLVLQNYLIKEKPEI